MPDILTAPVSPPLHVGTRLVVPPSPDIALAVDLLLTLGFAPTSHVSPALIPLFRHAHQLLSPIMPALAEAPSAGLGVLRIPARPGGQ
jgi:hypothetical protein